jgi:hypothetical protein
MRTYPRYAPGSPHVGARASRLLGTATAREEAARKPSSEAVI